MKIQVIASGSKGNCYLVSDGATDILIECGIPIKAIRKALSFNLSNVSGCLVTHSHKDHCKSAVDIMRSGIDLYTSRETAEAINLSGHRLFCVRDSKAFIIGSWTILPFDTVHDAEGSLGFLLTNGLGEKLLFLTDTGYCKYRFHDLTHIMVECNFSDEILDKKTKSGEIHKDRRTRLKKYHFSFEKVKDLLKVNDLDRLQEIFLLHLSDGNSDEALFWKEIRQLTGVPVHVA